MVYSRIYIFAYAVPCMPRKKYGTVLYPQGRAGKIRSVCNPGYQCAVLYGSADEMAFSLLN